MSGDPSSPSSRGHLILKSHAPFPQFRCAIPVPPPTSLIFQLRNTILAILTGQTKSTTASTSTSSNSEVAGLSYSEHLKQQTLHEWRLKSLVLELRQNALIAPETRDRMEDEEQDDLKSRGKGFVLLDEHECALLEHGDEINVWLGEGQEIDSLRLPKLSSRHSYGLPNQPPLTRSGTLLGPPPPYSNKQEEYEFGTPSANLIEPAEPSSHSSSVSAHPNGQYETTMRHKNTPAGWHRVLYVNSSNGNSPGENTANGTAGISAAVKNGKRTKPKRLMSEGSNALLDQTAKPVRRNSSNLLSHATFSRTAVQNASDSEQLKDESSKSPLHSPPTSPSLSNKEILMSQVVTESSLPKAVRTEREKIRKAGQRAMPSQALVIGPGVQGKVGRMSGGDTTNDSNGDSGEYGNMEAFVSFTAASSEVHQNRKSNNGPLSSRRMSSKSGASEKQERAAKVIEAARRSGEAQNDSNGRASGLSVASALATSNNGNQDNSATSKNLKNKFPIVKRYVKLPEKPELPPIRNLMPFEQEGNSDRVETSMAMPTPSPLQTPSATDMTSNSTQSQREIQLAQDAALAQALSESLNPERGSFGSAPVALVRQQSRPQLNVHKSTSSADASKLLRRQKTGESKPSIERKPSINRHSSAAELSVRGKVSNSGGGDKGKQTVGIEIEDVQQMSKAERRYNEVKKTLEAEKIRQAEQEKARKEKAKKDEEEREKALQKIEQERRQKEEKLRWQVWDEVRLRQAKEQAR